MAEITGDRTSEMQKRLDSQIKKALHMIGGTIAGYAADLCPVDTGLLRNSITFALSGEPANIATYTNDSGKRLGKNGKPIESVTGHYQGTAPTEEEHAVYIGTNVQYAPYQELGAPNAHVPPAPFLRPACEGHREEINRIMRSALKGI